MENEKELKTYGQFVENIVENIAYGKDKRIQDSYAVFGEPKALFRQSNDSAIITGEQLTVFMKILKYLCLLSQMQITDFEQRIEILSFSAPKYHNSCYKKNLLRWCSGTVSRSRKCRMEFVALAIGWSWKWKLAGDLTSEQKVEIKNLWNLSEKMYKNSLALRKKVDLS